ncbi:hypothetical protein WA016_01338 [Myxococcus stipitatus]
MESLRCLMPLLLLPLAFGCGQESLPETEVESLSTRADSYALG